MENTNIINKQATLSNGTAVTHSQAILSGIKTKNIVPGTDISLTSDENNITVTGVDAYDSKYRWKAINHKYKYN